MVNDVEFSLTSDKDLRKAAVPRALFSDKRKNGSILIIGGSYDFSHGAPVMASNAAYNTLAALRVGAGYARTYVPEKVLNVVRSLSPNIMVSKLGTATIEFNNRIKKEIERADSIALGMGIGKQEKTLSAVSKMINCALVNNKKTVVDAEALIAVKRLSKKKKLNKNIILTPHDRELYHLSGLKVSKVNVKDRVSKAVKVAKGLNVIVVLKGHYTIITDGKRVKLNKAKSSALATMGSGDTLSGIVAGYAALGVDMFEAATAAVYLHSKIGDKLYKAKGNHVIATDIVSAIPEVLKKFDKIHK